MSNELLQFLPSSSVRRQGEAWKHVGQKLDELHRQVQGSSRTSSSVDQGIDRLVPQVFAARIVSSSSQAIASGKSWWTYQWIECERTVATAVWTDVTVGGRNSTRNGIAWNSYETSIVDDGGNIIPATPIRLAYPNNAVVKMIIDPSGRAWFDKPNPVQIC